MMNWRDVGNVPYDRWQRAIAAVNGPAGLQSPAAYDAALPHTALCLAMLRVESQYGTAFFRNRPQNRNPLNLRPPDGDGYLAFASWVAGVHAWRNRLTSATYKGGIYARTVTLDDLVAVYAPKSDDNDPVAYADMIRDLWRSWGVLERSAEMIDAPLLVSLIPGFNRNRPGAKLNTNDARWTIVQHTTGNTNPNAGALMHRDFVHAGGGPDRVSFHFVVDDRWIVQLLPVDEIGWHAGDGCNDRGGDVGCFDSVGIELCVNAGADWARAKDHLARLYAMLAVGDMRIVGMRPGWFSLDRVTTHRAVSDDNKYCPTQLLNEGSLPIIIAQARQYAGLVPEATYAKPIVYPWLDTDAASEGKNRVIGRTPVFYLPQTYVAIRETPRRQATGANQKVIGPPIEEGERFAADYVYRSGGRTFVLTRWGTRVEAAALLPKVQIGRTGTISVRRTKDGDPEIARRGAA
ncbi:MAG: N-acetylmuramoyl-L-alanine amidase [Myxococcales bacterium]|nr:MAG: N-acetylmuramoyl-L-alanine amidase [Myxococcales bacterium]